MLTLLSLPFEILSEVLKYLPSRDILRLQRVDTFFYRRLFVDIDVWLILNKFLLHDCGVQYDVPGLFSNRDEVGFQATRQLVIAPCRLWKHIQRSSHSEFRRTLGFPVGYRVRCMSLLPGGRWLLVAHSGGSLDLWDVHFAVPYKTSESPTTSTGHKWTVNNISLHPDSPNCFVAVVEFTDEVSDSGGSPAVRDAEHGDLQPPDAAKAFHCHCAVVLISVPNSRDKSPSLTLVSTARQLGRRFRYCGDVIICDDSSSPGGPKAWNWRRDVRVEMRCSWDVACSKSACQDDEHAHHVIPHRLGSESGTVTSICYPDRTQRTFRIPDTVSMTVAPVGPVHVESTSSCWVPELCQPEHAAESDFHQHTLVMEYAFLGRPPRARFPEFFVDICSANGMSIGYVDRHSAQPPVLVRPVRFYALALDGVVRIYPHEDEVLVLVLMASNRSLSNYDEDDTESRRGYESEVDEDRGAENDNNVATGSAEGIQEYRNSAKDVVTIFGFVIPIAGIYAGRFTKDGGHDHLVRSFAISEHLVGDEEVAVMGGSEEGYLDKIAYDFISGRIVLSGFGSKGVIVLDFDELCVTGSI